MKRIKKVGVVVLITVLSLFTMITASAEAPSMESANVWLESTQNDSGNWEESVHATLGVLEFTKNLSSNTKDDAQDFVEDIPLFNNDFLFRSFSILNTSSSNVDALKESQNTDGGFSLARGYTSDAYDTILALRALVKHANDYDLKPEIEAAIIYLLNQQNDDGSFSYIKGSKANTRVTAQAIDVLVDCAALYEVPMNIYPQIYDAADYLTSQMNADGHWGLLGSSLNNTLFATQAILKTKGLNEMPQTVVSLASVQQQNGSFENNAYTTALASNALYLAHATSNASILEMVIKDVEGNEKTEFGAYEYILVTLDTDIAEEDDSFTEIVFLQQPSEDKDLYDTKEPSEEIYFDTEGYDPGEYLLTGLIKDKETGVVCDAIQKTVTIQETFEINDMMVELSDPKIRVGDEAPVDADITLYTKNNVGKSVNINVEMLDENGQVIVAENFEVMIDKGDLSVNLPNLTCTPVTDIEKTYTLNVEVILVEETLFSGTEEIIIYPPKPETRVGVSYALPEDKPELLPGNDNVDIDFMIEGIGENDGTGNTSDKPVELVFIVDFSWSFEGTPMAKTQEALLRMVETLGEDDICSIIKFNFMPKYIAFRETDKEVLKDKIENFPPLGSYSCLHIGLMDANKLIRNHSSDEYEKVFVVISDGYVMNFELENQARIAVIRGVTIHSIIFATEAGAYRTDLMQMIADRTGGTTTISPNPEDLGEVIDDVLGSILSSAGQDFKLSLTVNSDHVEIDEDVSLPLPTEIIEKDGATELVWQYDQIAMGEQIPIDLNLLLESLDPNEGFVVVSDIYYEYINPDGVLIHEDLESIILPVSDYTLDISVTMDKDAYTADEDVAISIDMVNANDYTLDTKVEVLITDADGEVLVTLLQDEDVQLSEQSEQSIDATWNTKDTLADDYTIVTNIFVDDVVIFTIEKVLVIEKDGEIAANLAMDSQGYLANQDVVLTTQISNTSSNAIEETLSLLLTITNTNDEIVFEQTDELPTLYPSTVEEQEMNFNTGQLPPGVYTVKSIVIQAGNTVCEQVRTFEIFDSIESMIAVTGTIKVDTTQHYPGDDVTMNVTLTNTGNVDIDAIAGVVQIVDMVNTLVVFEDSIDIEDMVMNEVVESEITAENINLTMGEYMVVLKAVLANDKERPLASSGYKVYAPYSISVNEVVRPRVLVYVDDDENEALAKQVLKGMNVYYTIATSNDEFIEKLSTGNYNTYAMLGTKKPLTGHDDEVLAAEIENGKGLVLAASANGDDLKKANLSGGKFTGTTKLEDYELSYDGNQVVISGKVQKIELITGTALVNAITDKEDELPMIIENTYGTGKVRYFAFDLGVADGDTATMLKKALLAVSPSASTGDLHEYVISLKPSTSIDARVEITIADAESWLWSDGEVTDNVAVWDLSLTEGKNSVIRILLKSQTIDTMVPEGLKTYYVIDDTAFEFEVEMD